MRNSVLILVIVSVISSSLPGTALAGRPLSTDDAGTVEPGHLEVELGAEYLKIKGNEKESTIAAALTTGIIWDRLDFGVEVPYLWLDPGEGDNVNGFGDLKARLKLRFIDETDTIPALAATAGVKTETGDSKKGLGTGKVDFVGNLIATKEIGRLTLHGNAGYNFTGDIAEEKEFDLINLSLAGEFAVNQQFRLVAEIVAEIVTQDIDEDNPVETLVGATYELPIGTGLDAGAAFGLTDGAPDYKITAGLTHEF